MTAPDRRVGLVMAGSKGIGWGCAQQLADSGCDLVVCARDRGPLDAAAAELAGRGAQVATVAADVATAEGVELAFARADERFGRLDVLVANAGGPPPGDFAALTDDDWRTGYELTLMSAVRAIRAAVPRLRAAGGGRIVVIGSSSTRMPVANLTLSNAYRPALVGLVKSLAGELAGDGITINMVSPGRIDTDRVRTLDQRAADQQGVTPQEAKAAAEAKVPLGRYGTVSEIGALVAFLASEAAGYITGQATLVDGGMVRSLP